MRKARESTKQHDTIENSSVSFSKVSAIFRLKKNHKKQFIEIFTVNLMAYLKRVSCHINMDPGDFREALKKLDKE